MDLREIFKFQDIKTCMLCGSSEQHDAKGVSWQGVPFSYAICAACGLKYMRPRPTQESYWRFYSDEYWQGNMGARGFKTATDYDDKSKDQLALRMPKYENVYRAIKSELTSVMSLSSATKVVEVGCAFGFSMEWIKRDFGVQAFGIEPSEESRKRCAEGGVKMLAKTGEEFFNASMRKKNKKTGEFVENEQFDAVVFSHVLETIAEPKEMLLGVRERLTPNGVLLLHVPNVFYYDAMAPICPYIYSPETITRLLAMCGLEVFRIDSPPTPTLANRASIAPRYNMAVFARRGSLAAVSHPVVDPLEILNTIEIGNNISAQAKLSVGELGKRAAVKVAQRAKREVTLQAKKVGLDGALKRVPGFKK
jgi:SAM-dependent methyltransferase